MWCFTSKSLSNQNPGLVFVAPMQIQIMQKIVTFLSLVLMSKMSLAQFPVFSISSPQGFLITCGNPTVNVFVVTLPPSALNYSFSFTSPGNYALTVGSGTATTLLPISINANTVTPVVNVTSTGTLLSCAVPSIQLQGSSATASVNYLWAAASQGTIASTASISVNANYSIAPSTLPFNIYTLTVTNPANQCTSSTVITIYQNIYRPNAAILSGTTC